MTTLPMIVRPGEGRSVFLSSGANTARILVPSGAGDFSIFQSTVPVNPAGVPLHVHRGDDEAFLILEGVVDVVAGEREERCAVGTLVFVPRGTSHRFANLGPATASMLVIGSARVQAMVEELAPIIGRQPPDPEAIAAAFARYDSALVAPTG